MILKIVVSLNDILCLSKFKIIKILISFCLTI
jgi:hypothetical protein